MRKSWYLPFLLVVILTLVGCNAQNASETETSENVNETTDIIEGELEKEQEEELRKSDDAKTDTELENEPTGDNGEHSNDDEATPATDDVGGQGVTDDGQNTDANNELD